MEDAIDTNVQGGTANQVLAVQQEAEDIMTEILESGKDIDAFLWHSKHAPYYKNVEPSLTFSNVSYLQKVRMEGAKWFKTAYETYADSIPERVNYTPIHRLGARFLPQAVQMLKWYRRCLYEQNSSSRGAPDWDATADIVVEKIEGFEAGPMRDSFVLSLYSATLQLPLSSGKVSDQFIMQPKIFPYLMKALQNYGLIGYLRLSEETNSLVRTYVKEWKLVDASTNKLTVFTDALDYQNAYFTSIEKTAHA
jgi:hypothetical protein